MKTLTQHLSEALTHIASMPLRGILQTQYANGEEFTRSLNLDDGGSNSRFSKKCLKVLSRCFDKNEPVKIIVSNTMDSTGILVPSKKFVCIINNNTNKTTLHNNVSDESRFKELMKLYEFMSVSESEIAGIGPVTYPAVDSGEVGSGDVPVNPMGIAKDKELE